MDRRQAPKEHVPFVGQSSYKDQYQGYQVQAPAPQSLRAAPVYAQGPKFEGQSAYKEQFRDRALEMMAAGLYQQQPRQCPCVRLNAPAVNHSEQPHIRYNAQLRAFE
jgi:hypothetical protein